jgi:hypothetical protein
MRKCAHQVTGVGINGSGGTSPDKLQQVRQSKHSVTTHQQHTDNTRRLIIKRVENAHRFALITANVLVVEQEQCCQMRWQRRDHLPHVKSRGGRAIMMTPRSIEISKDYMHHQLTYPYAPPTTDCCKLPIPSTS